jgi:alanyl-tRNA synthetase
VTQRLYYHDSHLTDFEARVVAQEEEGKRIFLDRTAFYPTSGGQSHDVGRLNGIEILDVVDEGDRIAHILGAPLAADTVRGQVDWSRRLDHMQQHTGQHLLSAVFADLLGYSTVSVHLGELSSTLDLDAAQLTPEQIAQVEDQANQIIAENRPVTITFEDAATARGLRKAPAREGSIRVITIENLDRSACGGTHVSATGEIGSILLRKLERIRKGVRLEFFCGLRAVRQSRTEYAVLARLAGDLSSSTDELPQLIANQRAELKQAAATRRQLETDLNRYRAQELYTATAPAPGSGIRRTVVRLSTGSLEELRGLAQAFTTLPRSVFIGAAGEPASVLLGASADSNVHAGNILKDILAATGGRGGGSATFAQGVLRGAAELDQAIALLENKTERGTYPAEG